MGARESGAGAVVRGRRKWGEGTPRGDTTYWSRASAKKTIVGKRYTTVSAVTYTRSTVTDKLIECRLSQDIGQNRAV